jgi:predicted metallopeptidase
MVVPNNTIIKRIYSLEKFARSKSKLVTTKRIDVDIVIGLKNHNNTGKAVSQIRVIGNIDTNKYHYHILLDNEWFERLPINELKNIILHEMSHIPDYEKVIHSKTQKECAAHGSGFKRACKQLHVPEKYTRAHADIEKPKRRIVKLK